MIAATHPADEGKTSRDTSQLKGYSQASSFAPNDTAAFLGAAEQQFKSIGQLGLPPYFEAGATGRIIYNSAINDGSFRANDQFGHVGSSACWPNACKPSRMHDSSPCGKIQQTGSQTILKIPFNSSSRNETRLGKPSRHAAAAT